MRIATSVTLAAMAALVAVAPSGAPAEAATRSKSAKPKITRVTPMRVEVGETLTIRGRNFKAKKARNTVVFKGVGGRTAFSKPRSASRNRLVVKIPGSVSRLLIVNNGEQRPTRLQLRVLAGKFSAFTPRRLSPVVLGFGSGDGGPGGGKPPPVCNSDSDHDNDLLLNQQEIELGTDPCLMDTDGDGIEDGYEYQSAKDLNDDEFQDPNTSLPYPGKRPYPNPLDPSDRDTDFDRDVLTLREEQKLWRYGVGAGRAPRTLTPLYYSDGEQFSMSERGADGRRRPNLLAAGYALQQSFLSWASENGYRTVLISDGPPWWGHETSSNPYGLLDVNRDNTESPTIVPGYRYPETTYYDLLPDGFLSDDERDEDADGLTNYDETHGRATSEYWAACYAHEAPFGLLYADPDVADPDSDGDGVRDGADDQDHDDIPNIMELSRLAASGLWDVEPGAICKPAEGLPTPPDTHHAGAYGRVNPFNPCLPAIWSRTCTLHPSLAGDGAPFDNSLNWISLN